MDFWPVAVGIGAKVPRMTRPEHGVVTAAVPWAKPGSRFAVDFAFAATWTVRGGLGKKRVAELLRIDRETVGRLVDLSWRELGPDVGKRFDGIVGTGIDETGYRKGSGYVTIVANRDTMIGLVMLFCSPTGIPWPGRKRNAPANTGSNELMRREPAHSRARRAE